MSPIRRQAPVEEYLRLQTPVRASVRRRRHGADVIARLQAIADRNIGRFGLLPGHDGTEARS